MGTNFVADSYDDLPLMELEVQLKQQVDDLQNLKDKRLETVEKLTAKVNNWFFILQSLIM